MNETASTFKPIKTFGYRTGLWLDSGMSRLIELWWRHWQFEVSATGEGSFPVKNWYFRSEWNSLEWKWITFHHYWQVLVLIGAGNLPGWVFSWRLKLARTSCRGTQSPIALSQQDSGAKYAISLFFNDMLPPTLLKGCWKISSTANYVPPTKMSRNVTLL